MPGPGMTHDQVDTTVVEPPVTPPHVALARAPPAEIDASPVSHDRTRTPVEVDESYGRRLRAFRGEPVAGPPAAQVGHHELAHPAQVLLLAGPPRGASAGRRLPRRPARTGVSRVTAPAGWGRGSPHRARAPWGGEPPSCRWRSTFSRSGAKRPSSSRSPSRSGSGQPDSS